MVQYKVSTETDCKQLLQTCLLNPILLPGCTLNGSTAYTLAMAVAHGDVVEKMKKDECGPAVCRPSFASDTKMHHVVVAWRLEQHTQATLKQWQVSHTSQS